MTGDVHRALPALLLASAAALVDEINAGVAAAGYADLRPTHGFLFVRLSPDGASIGQLADHLAVTKQAASQLVEELERKGYVRRDPHPQDGRARLVTLTERGRAATRAADEAAAQAVQAWTGVLGEREVARLTAALARVAPAGRIRPALW